MKRLLPLLCLMLTSGVLAESGSYRVEVIVFRNLAVTVDAQKVDDLYNYARFPALEESDLPDDLVALTKKSTRMDGVWHRLRSSKGYRPLIFAAWEQNRTDYYPPMRIHDEVAVETQTILPVNFIEAIQTQVVQTNGVSIDTGLEAEDPLAAYTVSFYRLDGTVQLKRSRFLHLLIDIEYREKSTLAASRQAFFNVENNAGSEVEIPAGYGVYHLKQNRQTRTGQMQYFDTPYFGVLVYVTPISAPG